VDLAEIQAAYYLVAATGVLVAAAYYILNMRETGRNRRATLTNSLIQPFTTTEFGKLWNEFTAMKWDNFEDFKSKYDSRVNPDNFSKRIAFFNLCDSIGYQVKTGLLDVGTVYNVAGIWIAFSWDQFGQVIKEYRKSDYPVDAYENWENLSKVLSDMRQQKDAEWRIKLQQVLSTH
jgi:hypothetical protein